YKYVTSSHCHLWKKIEQATCSGTLPKCSTLLPPHPCGVQISFKRRAHSCGPLHNRCHRYEPCRRPRAQTARAGVACGVDAMRSSVQRDTGSVSWTFCQMLVALCHLRGYGSISKSVKVA